ncbi:MAG: tetratricopeptide repeat protein [Myxococcaceae bacterium]|nr:tetratricopeptide repeat protein [Myxococcaceae bacterium]
MRLTISLLILSVFVVLPALAAPSAAAKVAFERGEKALGSGDLAGAEAAYKEAIAASPDYAEAINGLGSTYFKQGKREEAIAQFRAAIQANPKFPLAWFNLGFAARKVKDYATAVQAYENYTKLKPDDPDGFYGLGDSYRGVGNYPAAIAAFEQYVARENRPSEEKYKEKAKQIIAELKAAQAAQPPDATASAPGQTAEQPVVSTQQPASGQTAEQPPASTQQPASGQTAEQRPASTQQPASGQTAQQPTSTSQPASEQTAQQAPDPNQQPTQPSAPLTARQAELLRRKLGEGDLYMGQRRFREASFAYQDAVNADPNSVEALFKLGNAYAQLGYYSQAIDKWNRVLSLTRDPGVRKSAQDNIAKAQSRMAQAGGGAPQSQGQAPGSGPVAAATRAKARAAYEEGVRFINAGNYDAAVRSLTEAIQLEPTLAVAFVARGSAYIGLRRYAEAAADYQYANRLEPNLSSPLYGLAEAFRAMGRTADARNYYEQYAASTASDVRPELQVQAREKAAALR